MKSNLIVPVMFLVVFLILTVAGADFVSNWKSFLAGALFALSLREVGGELLRRVAGR